MRNNSTFARGFLLAVAMILAAPALISAQTAVVQRRITEAIDEAKLTPLHGNTHPLARPEFDRGAAPLSLPMQRMLLVLKRSAEQEAGLGALLDQQQDKSSPNYHGWLTPEQFGQQFGPSDQDMQTVMSWLQSHGFQVARVSKGRTVIEFSGTHAQVREAFHTEIHKYTVDGEDHWANASDPQIPSALAPVVGGIDTLHNFRKQAMNHVAGLFGKSQRTGRVEPIAPEFTYTCGTNNSGQPVSCYPVTPYDFATIYNVLPLWTAASPIDGSGQTIAIVARTNINLQDVSDFRSLFGLPAKQPKIILDGPDPGIVSGDETESDLDVEWSGAVAKGATIDLVASQSTETSDGVDLSAEYIVDNNLAPIMSESYGLCEAGLGTAGNQFENNLWQQAAAQGMTVFVSSGDDGSAGCDRYTGSYPQPANSGLQVNGLASTPYNVAVGGTDFNDYFSQTTYWSPANNATTQASALSYIPETTWNSTCTNAIYGDPRIGYSTDPEANCNNSQLVRRVRTAGGSGGKSNCTAPTGSGVSTCAGGYSKPVWQAGAGVPSDGKRDIPDVSLFASSGFFGSFYMMCEADFPGASGPCSTNNFVGIGGTSASAPAFAGIMALVGQKTAVRQGNANYILYKLAAPTGASCNSSNGAGTNCVFYDVTNGTIAMACATGTRDCTTKTSGDQYGILSGYATTTGYDLATGLGSVNAANLVNAWNTANTALAKSTTTLQLNSGAAVNITHGASVPVSISVAPASGTGTPTGNVSLIAETGPNGATDGVQGFVLSSGSSSGTTNALPGGTYNVVAQYAGDGTFGSSTSSPPVSVTVAPEASKVQMAYELFDPTTGLQTSANATTATFGTRSLLRLNVTSQAGDACPNNAPGDSGCATGSVTLTDSYNGGSAAALDGGSFALNSQGYAEDQAIDLAGGTHNLGVTYAGDSSFSAPSPNPTTQTLTITPTATQITVSTNLISSVVGSSVALIANFSAQNIFSSHLPTGTVTFYSGTAQVGQASLSGNAYIISSTHQVLGTTSTSTTSLPHGQDSITAQYSGDASYATSTSAPVNVTILYATTTTVATSNPSVPHGTSVTFTANVTTGQSTTPITGTVLFAADSVALGSPVTISNGQAQISTSSLSGGSHTITAEYQGDSNYAISVGSTSQTVTLTGTTTAVSASSSTITQGSNVTFTATITPAQNGGPALTGTVQFASNGSNIGGTVSVSNGQAQLQTNSLAVGSDQITATYSGDSNYSGSTSPAVTVTVNPTPTFTVTANPTTINTGLPGQSGSTTLTFTSQNGFTGSATLSPSMCSGLPSESSCSFSPSTITLAANGTATTTLTVMTTAHSTVVPDNGNRPRFLGWRTTGSAVALAGLLCLAMVEFGYRGRQRQWGFALVFTVFVLLAVSAGCSSPNSGGGGGGGGNPGTPAGTTPIIVTITINGVAVTVPNLMVNVQ